jgi:hypothetical protein
VSLLASDGKWLFASSSRSGGISAFDLKSGKEQARIGYVPKAVTFGRSSFRDNNWFQWNNSKGKLEWKDHRASSALLVSGKDMTCGVSLPRRLSPKIGLGHYGLFGSRGRRVDGGWKAAVPLIPRAMVLTADVLFVAGIPDPVIPELNSIKDNWKRLQLGAELPVEQLSPKGGELWAVNAADGKKLSEIKLDEPPVFDGLAAAGGRLFLCTTDGKVVCLGKK